MTVFVQRFKGPSPRLKLRTAGLPSTLTVLAASHADRRHRGQSVVEVALLNSRSAKATSAKKLVLGLTVPGAALSLGIVAPNMLGKPAQRGLAGGLRAFCNSGSAANIAHYLRVYLRGSSALIGLLHSLGAFITDTVCGRSDPEGTPILNALGFSRSTSPGGTGGGSHGTGTTGSTGSTGGGGTGGGGSGPPCSVVPTLQYAPTPSGEGWSYPIQVVGTCAGIVGQPLYYIRLTVISTTPASKTFHGVESDSNPALPPAGKVAPGCSELPTGSLTCNVEYNESDGGICTHVTATAGGAGTDFTPGDQIKIDLLDRYEYLISSSIVSYASQTLAVPSASSTPCHL